MKLKELVTDNNEYLQLVSRFEDRLKNVEGLIDKKEFVQEEILRIQKSYLKPLTAQITGDFKMVSGFNFTEFVKHGYEWLKSGHDYDIEQIVQNAKQGSNHLVHNEQEFFKAVLANLTRGVSLVLYERFLKQQLGLALVEKGIKEVLVTYSWDGDDHRLKVLGLTQNLRQKGFSADIDVKLLQEETAIDFTKMMHRSFVEYQKIIIVLSKGYKQKAESFKGGVGTEYRLMLSDIQKHPNKYIFVSLEPMSDSIIPLGIDGREIVDLKKPGNDEKLLRKLMDAPEYKFAEVAESKPFFTTKIIEPFLPVAASPSIVINDIITGRSLAQTQFRLIRLLKAPCRIEIKNTGSKTVTDAQIEVTMPKHLLEELYDYSVNGNLITFLLPVKKLYSGQSYQTPEFHLLIRNTNVHVINEVVTIKVYTEEGTSERAFLIKDFVKHFDEYFGTNPRPLREDMFLDIHQM
ncbi:MAG TPA: SEFIR domain-containing protein [Chryseolinea sp.]|nr:SEFIR domain-containing protein [Chryseolinea sp.]